MFDPHRTRDSNKRYYTRKGQVIQARRVDAPLGIEGRLVPMYRDFILKNKLITGSDFPLQTPVINAIRFSIDGSTTLYEDLAQTISPQVVNNSIGIAIGTDTQNPDLWHIYIFLVIGPTIGFTIPKGFRWKSWSVSRVAINAYFELLNDDAFGYSFPIQHEAPGVSQNLSAINNILINKTLLKFE